MIFMTMPDNFELKFEVVSCICEYKGKILLLKRNKDKPQGNTWAVPAGKVNISEKLEDAIERELSEEINQKISSKDLNYFTKVYIKFKEYHFIYHLFSIKFHELPDIKLNENEHQTYVWKTPEEALKMNLIQDEAPCIKLFYNL